MAWETCESTYCLLYTVPSKPGIGSLEVGDDCFLVSWKPYAENENTQNPGSMYCVEYRPEGMMLKFCL